MNGMLVALGLGVGALGVVELFKSRAANTKARPKTGCRLTTEESIFLTNQAFVSGDYQLIQATMAVLWDEGCIAEGNAISQYLYDHGYNPNIAILPEGVPMGGPGQVVLQPGEVWRAAAILGGVGCAVGLQTIAEKVAEKGFSNVTVSSKNPGWGSQWDANEGFLECTRYVQATVSGKARAMSKPKQVYRLERVSTSS